VLGAHHALEWNREATTVVPHLGLVLRMNDVVALLAEGGLNRWREPDPKRIPWGFVAMDSWAGLGVRLGARTGRRIVVDLAVVATHQPGEILILPWLSGTFRTDPIKDREPPAR
jgi:hypothetical protein